MYPDQEKKTKQTKNMQNDYLNLLEHTGNSKL